MPVMVGKSLNLHFLKIWNITQIKKPLGDHWFCRCFWEFCVPPLVCKVETLRCLWTTAMRICLIRATLRDALSDSLLGRGMVSNSHMLRHIRAEITYLLHLPCHWVSECTWRYTGKCVELNLCLLHYHAGLLVSRKFTHTYYDAGWFYRVHSPSQTDRQTVLCNR